MNFQDPWIASGKKKSFTLDQLANLQEQKRDAGKDNQEEEN